MLRPGIFAGFHPACLEPSAADKGEEDDALLARSEYGTC